MRSNFFSISGLMMLLCLGSFSLSGQRQVDLNKPLALEDCIYYAINHNPEIRRTQLAEKNNEYVIKEVKSSALPQINGTGQYLNNYALAEQILPGEVFGQPGTSIPVKFGVAHTMTANVELQQQLFNKSIFVGLKAAKSAQALYKLQSFKSTEDLVYNMVQVYLQIQVTKKQQIILEDNLTRIDQLIEIADIQFEEGLIKKIDVDQLSVNRTNIASQLLNLEIGLEQQMNFLKFYMGLSPEIELSLSPYQLDDSSYPLTTGLNLSRNTDLRLLEKQLELTQYDNENVKAGYYPSLSGFVRYGWQGQTDKLFSSEELNKVQGSSTGVIGLTLSVPIFDGFRKKYQSQQIRIQQEQLALDRMTLTNSIRMQYDNANETLLQNRRLVEAQQENMTLAASLYDVTKLSYQEGVAPLTELLNAENSLNEAQTQYLNAMLNLKLAELDHLETSGQLAQLISENTNQ